MQSPDTQQYAPTRGSPGPQQGSQSEVEPQLGGQTPPVEVHRPRTHDEPRGHAAPHPPQWLALLEVSTHIPAHAAISSGHEHLPEIQLVPLTHAFPQAPQ